MKTSNLIKNTAAVLVGVVLMTLVACGDKGSSGNQNPTGWGNCANCQNINPGAPFFQAQSQDSYGVITLNWNFSGQNFTQQPYQQPYGQPYQQPYGYQQPIYGGAYPGGYNTGFAPEIISYNGPVAASGQFIVMQSMSLGYCQLPGGTYNLTTLQAGQWNMGIIYNLRMQATGPANIALSMTTGQVSAKTGQQLGYTWNEIPRTGRIFGNLMVESVNGYPCQMSILVQ